MSFGDDLERFKKKAIENHHKVKRAAAFELFGAIVTETPVDKGVLRNNWFVEHGSPSSVTTSSADPNGQRVKDLADIKLRFTDNRDIYFTNNLPYAEVVEFGLYPNPPVKGKGLTVGGFSRKAPAGMVRIHVRRWDSIVDRHASRFR